MSQGFAEKLTQLRKQRDLSQPQLAGTSGFHQEHIRRYERGESKPSADALWRMDEALGVSTDYLIEDTSDEAAKALFEDRDLLPQCQAVARLPVSDKSLVKSLLDALVPKRKVEGLSAPERRGSAWTKEVRLARQRAPDRDPAALG